MLGNTAGIDPRLPADVPPFLGRSCRFHPSCSDPAQRGFTPTAFSGARFGPASGLAVVTHGIRAVLTRFPENYLAPSSPWITVV